jgi:hypothetical protein
MIKVLRLDVSEQVCFQQFQIEISRKFVVVFNSNLFI